MFYEFSFNQDKLQTYLHQPMIFNRQRVHNSMDYPSGNLQNYCCVLKAKADPKIPNIQKQNWT